MFCLLFALLCIRQNVCTNCNVIGNGIDSWFRLLMVTQMLDSCKDDCSYWFKRYELLDYHMRGIITGTYLYKITHFQYPFSYLHYIYSKTPYIHTNVSISFQHHIQKNKIHNYFWTDLKLLDNAVDALKRNIHFPYEQQNCVIHYRVGDFVDEENIESETNAIIHTFAPLSHKCKNVDFLDGGLTTHICKQDNCGRQLHLFMITKLKKLFPNVSFSTLINTPDIDFLKMINAPVLITGGGSFALFAAILNNNVKRIPNCILRFKQRMCYEYIANIVTYHHPNCRCDKRRELIVADIRNTKRYIDSMMDNIRGNVVDMLEDTEHMLQPL